MSQLDAYLFFDGNCADAMHFYERTLGGKLEILMKNADSPMAQQMPQGNPDGILHARMVIDGRVLMASDWMTDRPYEGMHGFSLSLTYPAIADAQRVFDALAKGGKVTMPLQKTFWSEAFAMLVDRFGTPWMINGKPASM